MSLQRVQPIIPTWRKEPFDDPGTMAFDPTRNIDRFYVVQVMLSLFGDWTVMRKWGGAAHHDTLQCLLQPLIPEDPARLSVGNEHSRQGLGSSSAIRTNIAQQRQPRQKCCRNKNSVCFLIFCTARFRAATKA